MFKKSAAHRRAPFPGAPSQTGASPRAPKGFPSRTGVELIQRGGGRAFGGLSIALRKFGKSARAGAVMAPLLLCACRTMPPLPQVNLSDPRWTVRQGQVLWRPDKDSPELAGELLVATQTDDSSFVQFTKSPLPVLVAQTTAQSWQVHSVPDDRTRAGRGNPPTRIVWLELPRCLAGLPPRGPWQWKNLDGRWHLYNPHTGESLEGYLSP